MTKYNISSPQLEEMDRQQSCNKHSKTHVKDNTENLKQHKDNLNDDGSKENKNHAAEEIKHEKLLTNSDNLVESINTGFLLISLKSTFCSIIVDIFPTKCCLQKNCMCVCMPVCVSVCLYVCMYVCLFLFVCRCLYVCLFVCIYVCMSVCMYDVCMYVYLSVCLCV